MDIRFLAPDVRRLDEASVEVAAGTCWNDERPARGFAGLLDWRLGGRLSALLTSGFFEGNGGEVILVPGKPHVPFEKVLLFGLGARAAFGEHVFRDTIGKMARTLEGLRVRRAVVELPGRGVGAIDAERAIVLALESLGPDPEHDAWWLVEDAPAQKRIEQRVRSTQRVASVAGETDR